MDKVTKTIKRTLQQTIHTNGIALALVVRLLFLTTTPSLAAAAPLPDYVPGIVATELASTSISPLDSSIFLQETNAVRNEFGLGGLSIDASLTDAAQRKIADMQEKGYWDHFRPSDGKAPWDFIKESGYGYKVAGENLAKGFETARGITSAWLASPAHRANLLSAKYTEVGFATGYIETPSGRVLLTVQMFGSR